MNKSINTLMTIIYSMVYVTPIVTLILDIIYLMKDQYVVKKQKVLINIVNNAISAANNVMALLILIVYHAIIKIMITNIFKKLIVKVIWDCPKDIA